MICKNCNTDFNYCDCSYDEHENNKTDEEREEDRIQGMYNRIHEIAYQANKDRYGNN